MAWQISCLFISFHIFPSKYFHTLTLLWCWDWKQTTHSLSSLLVKIAFFTISTQMLLFHNIDSNISFVQYQLKYCLFSQYWLKYCEKAILTQILLFHKINSNIAFSQYQLKYFFSLTILTQILWKSNIGSNIAFSQYWLKYYLFTISTQILLFHNINSNIVKKQYWLKYCFFLLHNIDPNIAFHNIDCK